jgi:hypothetical protein
VGYLPGLRPALVLDMSGTMHGCHLPLKRVVRPPHTPIQRCKQLRIVA